MADVRHPQDVQKATDPAESIGPIHATTEQKSVTTALGTPFARRLTATGTRHMMPGLKVFITGGTGFVGREILWKLREAGHSIRLLSRHPKSDAARQLAYRHQAEIVGGSATDRQALAEGMESCDAVIHLVGIIAEFGENTFQSAHVGATRSVVEAAETAGIRRFLQMSALGTHANASSTYHRTKWEAEQIVRSSPIDWTIFRPSVIFGREDAFVNLLAKLCRLSPVVPVMGAGKNRLQPIAVEDVAHCFVAALARNESVHQTYDLCGPDRFTMDELMSLILRTTGRKRLQVHIPMPLARVQAAASEVLFGLVGRQSPLTRDQLKMLQEDNIGDPEAACRVFDLTPMKFADGIARYVR